MNRLAPKRGLDVCARSDVFMRIDNENGERQGKGATAAFRMSHAMKHFFTILFAAAVLMAQRTAQAVQVLWFSVNPDAFVSEYSGGGTTVLNLRDSNGNAVNAARIRVVGQDVPANTFLDLYYEDGGGGWVLEKGVTIADFTSDDMLQWQPADLGGYGSGGNRVVLELGYFDETNMSFYEMAIAYADVADLLAAGNISSGGVSPATNTPWSPDFTSTMDIPEPSSFALSLVGAAALLMLRRRRRRATHHDYFGP